MKDNLEDLKTILLIQEKKLDEIIRNGSSKGVNVIDGISYLNKVRELLDILIPNWRKN